MYVFLCVLLQKYKIKKHTFFWCAKVLGSHININPNHNHHHHCRHNHNHNMDTCMVGGKVL